MASVSLRDLDAIRVKAVYKTDSGNEFRCFSIDPNITSYEHIHQLLKRAFQFQSEFEISYLLPQSVDSVRKSDVFISLASDFDLDAAMQTASMPFLSLRVQPIALTVDESQEWTFLDSREAPPRDIIQSTGPTSTVPFKISLKHQMEKTFNKITNAFTDQTKKGPLKQYEWKTHLDFEGRLLRTDELWVRIFEEGIDHSIRKEVWPHLLNAFPPDLTSEDRARYLLMRSQVYWHLRQQWQEKNPQETETIRNMIMKDVLRTDRAHSYFAVPDDHPHINGLFNILVTYGLANPDISYAQGMNDLAGPLLVVLDDEAITYTCFCALMTRLKSHFMIDSRAMAHKFEHLGLLVQKWDAEFHKYLMTINADDMFFCYRWLLLDLKREFPFDDALRLMETIWSGLPPPPPTQSPDGSGLFVVDTVGRVSFKNSNAVLTSNGYNLIKVFSDKAAMENESSSSKESEGALISPKESKSVESKLIQLPDPFHLGYGNPFVLFICLSLLLQHRDYILQHQMDYNSLAMYFDKLVRKHDLNKTLVRAKLLFAEYLKNSQNLDSTDCLLPKDCGKNWLEDPIPEIPTPNNQVVEC